MRAKETFRLLLVPVLPPASAMVRYGNALPYVDNPPARTVPADGFIVEHARVGLYAGPLEGKAERGAADVGRQLDVAFIAGGRGGGDAGRVG